MSREFEGAEVLVKKMLITMWRDHNIKIPRGN
jgi:hypothetical protein